MEGISGIFFDLHGTLVISDDLPRAWDNWREAFYGFMVRQGLESSLEEFSVEINGIFEKPVPEFQAPELTVFERRVMELCSRHDIEMPFRYMDRMIDHIIGVWYSYMYTDPEAKKVLETLKPLYKLALITNWDHAPWLRRWLGNSEITRWFEEVVISDEAECMKPDPQIFRIALESLNLQPQEMAYVGDSPEDVKGALAVGSTPILISRDGVETEETEVRVISSLSELLDIFQ